MKASINDRQALLGIPPSQVAVYLRAQGWQQTDFRENRYSMWALPSFHGWDSAKELLLPLDQGIADFAERMADLLEDLQQVEQRSQLEILQDIRSSNCDVYRFRKHPPTSIQGTIPLEDGARFVACAKDFLLYAATAEHDPRRKAVGGRRANEVAHFMDQALLGQTEISSFVITAQVPVPNRLNETLFPEFEGPLAEPFERRAGLRLINLLRATRRAALEALKTSQLEPLGQLLNSGGTVGLYHTLVMAQQISSDDPLEISCRWSPGRPLIKEKIAESRITFEPEVIQPLREALDIFSSRLPVEGIQVVGYVELLRRPAQEELIGDFAIKAEVQGQVRNIRCSISRPDYDEIIVAFKDKAPIAITGDLVKEGPYWTLLEPRKLRIIKLET